MKKIILFMLVLSGCAILKGQLKYSGTGDGPVISEHIVNRPRFTMRYSYSSPVDKLVEVSNGSNKTLNVLVVCNYVQFPINEEITIPPHTTQQLLITTNVFYAEETLCSIIHYTVLQ